MSTTDLFSWLPDWTNGVGMKYRHNTVVDTCETGNEQARMPLYEKMKRTMTCRHFSPEYLTNIENFLRKMHANFFQVPLFSESIIPVGVFGSSLKNVTSVQSKGLLSNFNLNNLCQNVMMIDLQNYNRAELHTLVSVDNNTQFTIGGAFVLDFSLGNTVYYPVMLAYTNSFSDTLVTTHLEDTDLVFEEYF